MKAKKKPLTFLVTLLLMATMSVPALAAGFTHDVTWVENDGEVPYSVSPGDQVRMTIHGEAGASRIEITPDDAMQFEGIVESMAFDGNKATLPWLATFEGPTDGMIAVNLSDLPEGAAEFEITYACSINQRITNGQVGMDSRADIYFNDGAPAVSEITQPVYTLAFQIHTVNVGKNVDPSGGTVESSEAVLEGSVGGGKYQLFTDDTLTHALGFQKEFRIYTVAPDWDGNRITELDVDGGIVTVRGLRAGRYYLKEIQPPDGYSALLGAVPVDVVLNDDGTSEVQVISLPEDGNPEHVATGTKIAGPGLVINYGEMMDNPHVAIYIIALCLLGVGVVAWYFYVKRNMSVDGAKK